MSRRTTDALVTSLVIERLRRPDAADLFRPGTNDDDVKWQIAEQRHRRDEIADVLTEGLLNAATARRRLTTVAETLNKLESRRSPTLIAVDDLVGPAAAWAAWGSPNARRSSGPSSHGSSSSSGHRNGPRGPPGADDHGVGLTEDARDTLERNCGKHGMPALIVVGSGRPARHR